MWPACSRRRAPHANRPSRDLAKRPPAERSERQPRDVARPDRKGALPTRADRRASLPSLRHQMQRFAVRGPSRPSCPSRPSDRPPSEASDTPVTWPARWGRRAPHVNRSSRDLAKRPPAERSERQPRDADRPDRKGAFPTQADRRASLPSLRHQMQRFAVRGPSRPSSPSRSSDRPPSEASANPVTRTARSRRRACHANRPSRAACGPLATFPRLPSTGSFRPSCRSIPS
jgi:hypothetical protein